MVVFIVHFTSFGKQLISPTSPKACNWEHTYRLRTDQSQDIPPGSCSHGDEVSGWPVMSRLSEQLCRCDLRMWIISDQWWCVNKVHHLWLNMYSAVWRDEEEISSFGLLCLIHKIFFRIKSYIKIFFIHFLYYYNCFKDTAFLKVTFLTAIFFFFKKFI